MIQVMYSNPSAIISTNGLHSKPFRIFRGTRLSTVCYVIYTLLGAISTKDKTEYNYIPNPNTII
uniref:Uncharacterized protein n=1 Tax=Anguilla anguilla TaxID=7936 RepID=A0A0E9WLK8_ANGAN